MVETAAQSPRLLDRVREVARLKHFSLKTERSYLFYIRNYLLFHNKRHPREMGVSEIRAYLSYLATEKNVAASTQNVALNALLFLYRNVLEVSLPYINDIERARRPTRVPVVFTRSEAKAILDNLSGFHLLATSLLYGAGLRISECLRLRVKDIDFGYKQIVVRDGKGKKDRVTLLPEVTIEPLKLQLDKARAIHQQDLTEGYGEVELPYALARKYPNAAREWAWQYVFPAAKRSVDRAPVSSAAITFLKGHSNGP